jgi:hypothetical protein
VNAVAAGLRADVDHGVAGPRRLGEEEAVRAHDPDVHRVHEDVAAIRLVEGHLAADGGAAEAVAVVGDSRDHSAQQVALERLLEGTEAQRVQVRQGPRTHREDVAQDPAHSGCGTGVRLDE